MILLLIRLGEHEITEKPVVNKHLKLLSAVNMFCAFIHH